MIAWRADHIKPAMGDRQSVCLWLCPLTSRLSGPVHIEDHSLPTCSVKQTPERRKGFARQQILLREEPECLDTG